ncbi:hypothetical protein NKH41_12150 [Mesorhizobium sp. M1169]|uniref:hypothetical protein n=1 Tax=Mesorhizobium sp. M1169 TaxID=2957066 RepID=UPI00333631A1
MINQAQTAFLNQRGLTEETLVSADPVIRLQVANLGDVEDAPEPVIELNSLQREYLGDRQLSEITDLDRKNLEWLSTLKPNTEEPAEPTAPESKPHINLPPKLDGAALWANAHPDMRLAVYEAFGRWSKNSARASEADTLLVTPWLK